jgi:hypothetical protein
MKTILFSAVLLSLLTAGCYTKFYRPDMEQAGRGPYDTLYDRYDSTAIDTTLTKPEATETYPEDNYGWSYWGRPRGYTRWGFDFNNFSPDYYWTYYGYYDYYSRPWWDRYYDPWWYWGGGGSIAPSEPPSQRDYGRRGQPGGDNSVTPPPAPSGGETYTTPAPAPSNDRKNDQGGQKQGDTNKREGRRGR